MMMKLDIMFWGVIVAALFSMLTYARVVAADRRERKRTGRTLTAESTRVIMAVRELIWRARHAIAFLPEGPDLGDACERVEAALRDEEDRERR